MPPGAAVKALISWDGSEVFREALEERKNKKFVLESIKPFFSVSGRSWVLVEALEGKGCISLFQFSGMA